MDSIDVTQGVSGAMAADRRSNQWIDPKFQKRYALLLVSLIFVVSTVLVGTFWFYSEQILRTLKNAGLLESHSLFQLIGQQTHAMLLSVMAVVVLFSAFAFLIARAVSHTVVGPVFAIKRSLECIANGDYENARVNLRENDEFKDVADLINKAVDNLKTKRS